MKFRSARIRSGVATSPWRVTVPFIPQTIDPMPQRVLKIIRLLEKTYTNARYYLNFNNPLQLLVAAILSAQVRDEVVNATTPLLFAKYKTAKDFSKANPEELENIIQKITFFSAKAKHTIEACKILVEKYRGQVPDGLEDLVSLPGIGRKTANAILINGFNKIEGIVVDTHVIRVSQRLGWTREQNPDKIEKDLIKAIPKQHWKQIPWWLKDHGRAICKAPKPLCNQCVLEKLCPKVGV